MLRSIDVAWRTALVAALPAVLVLGSATGVVAQDTGLLVQSIPGTDLHLTFAHAPGGTFTIGSPADEPGRDPDEGPQRAVTLAPFWIAVHELTHDQYAVFRYRRLDSEATAVAGARFDVDAVSRPSPPYEDPAHGMGDADHPATGMTHWAALQYARWLSLKTGRLYRLPTEAEWEYACRAGSADAFPFSADTAGPDAHAWYAANSGDVFHRVGLKQPNAWGLHDMAGNVAEWTMDAYEAAAYAAWPDSVNPWTRPVDGGAHTVRGGAFDDDPDGLRCADRLPSTPRWQRRDPQLPKSRWWNTDSPHVGFRLVTPDRLFTLDEIRAYWEALLGP